MWSTLKRNFTIRGTKKKSISRSYSGPLAKPFSFPTKPADDEPEPEPDADDLGDAVDADHEPVEQEDEPEVEEPKSGDEEEQEDEEHVEEHGEEHHSSEEDAAGDEAHSEDEEHKEIVKDSDHESESSDVESGRITKHIDSKDDSTSERSGSVRSNSTDESRKKKSPKKTGSRKKRSGSVLEEITEDREASLVKPFEDKMSVQSHTDDESNAEARKRISFERIKSTEEVAGSEDERSSVDWSYQSHTDDEYATTETFKRRSADALRDVSEVKIEVDHETDLETSDQSERRVSKESFSKSDVVPSIRISKDFIQKIIFVDDVKSFSSGVLVAKEEEAQALELTIKEILPVKEMNPIPFTVLEENLDEQVTSLASGPSVSIVVSTIDEAVTSVNSPAASDKEHETEFSFRGESGMSDVEFDCQALGLETPKSEGKPMFSDRSRDVSPRPFSKKRKQTAQSDFVSDEDGLDEEIQGLLEEIDGMLEKKDPIGSAEGLQVFVDDRSTLAIPSKIEEASSIESPLVVESKDNAQKRFPIEDAGATDAFKLDDSKSEKARTEVSEVGFKLIPQDESDAEAGESRKGDSPRDTDGDVKFLKMDSESDDGKLSDCEVSTAKRSKTHLDSEVSYSKLALEAGAALTSESSTASQ